jgi:hypothetical protein
LPARATPVVAADATAQRLAIAKRTLIRLISRLLVSLPTWRGRPKNEI